MFPLPRCPQGRPRWPPRHPPPVPHRATRPSLLRWSTVRLRRCPPPPPVGRSHGPREGLQHLLQRRDERLAPLEGPRVVGRRWADERLELAAYLLPGRWAGARFEPVVWGPSAVWRWSLGIASHPSPAGVRWRFADPSSRAAVVQPQPRVRQVELPTPKDRWLRCPEKRVPVQKSIASTSVAFLLGCRWLAVKCIPARVP